jgi:hypothetical protein
VRHQTPSHAIRRLEALVGDWEMQASIGGHVMGRGHTAFEWLEDGAFLMQRADAEPPTEDAPAEWVANSPFPLVTIIGLDDSSDTFCYAYADARGVHRVYRMSLHDGVWKIGGQSGPQFFQRFTATFSDDGNIVAGRWEGSSDGSSWEPDFDVTYTKVR